MRKAIIVEFNFMTRIVIDSKDENIEFIANASKQNLLDKINNDELEENLVEWNNDLECPFKDSWSNQDVRDMLFEISSVLSYDDADSDELLISCQRRIKQIRKRLDE